MFDNAYNNTVNTDYNTNNKSVVNEINEHFKLPIYYNDKKMKIKQHIVTDLELIKTIDASGCKPIYNYFFNNDNDISEKLIGQVSEYYTTDIDFINQNEMVISGIKRKLQSHGKNSRNIKKSRSTFKKKIQRS